MRSPVCTKASTGIPGRSLTPPSCCSARGGKATLLRENPGTQAHRTRFGADLLQIVEGAGIITTALADLGPQHQVRLRRIQRRRRRIEQADEDPAGPVVQGRAAGQQRGSGHAGRTADHGDVAVAALVAGMRACRAGRRPTEQGGGRFGVCHLKVVEPDRACRVAALAWASARSSGIGN